MIINIFKHAAIRLTKGAGPSGRPQLYSLWKYNREDGSFDYERYRAAQEEANIRKIDNVWVQKPNIEFLSQYIQQRIPEPQFGLCHGTRRGLEQEWFSNYLNCEVWGTEISSTATSFPKTIQWDFHEVKEEWIGNIDFIYSNSLDHSYDPERCLRAWMSCLKDKGICILEYTADHTGSKESDPFGASIHVLPYLILQWSKGEFHVEELLEGPVPSRFGDKEFHPTFLVLAHSSWRKMGS